jgi:hypothetical protein
MKKQKNKISWLYLSNSSRARNLPSVFKFNFSHIENTKIETDSHLNTP